MSDYMGLQPSRIGKVTEYKRGHFYLTHTEWEDGHCEVEVHKCHPQLLFHTCDAKELELAKQEFLKLATVERQTQKTNLIIVTS